MDQASPLDLQAGETLFKQPCEFVLGVAGLDQLPGDHRGEVAFAGRSNVGKSSLVNALTNRKTLARTSHTPGRTQQLNYFTLGEDMYLVDMPGYGYAQVSKSIRNEWKTLIRSYLSGRANLRCVMILVDSRHGLKDTDTELMKMLDETAVPYRIILTKTDKTKNQERTDRINSITDTLKRHAAGYPTPFLTSAHKKKGIEELRAVIASYL